MASSSTVCTSCLRSMRSSFGSPSLVRNASRAYRMPTATYLQPLHLDFLAPSALKRPPKTSSSFARLQLQGHRRTLATAVGTPEDLLGQRHLARAILNPRSNDEGQPMLISISPRASNRLSAIAANDKNPNLALRITVESGGCHGFQYLMSLTDLSTSPPTEEDTVYEGDKGSKVVIDEASLELLHGSTVDFTMELIGSQFKITGIPGATSSCGCGTSFDIKI